MIAIKINLVSKQSNKFVRLCLLKRFQLFSLCVVGIVGWENWKWRRPCKRDVNRTVHLERCEWRMRQFIWQDAFWMAVHEPNKIVTCMIFPWAFIFLRDILNHQKYKKFNWSNTQIEIGKQVYVTIPFEWLSVIQNASCTNALLRYTAFQMRCSGREMVTHFKCFDYAIQFHQVKFLSHAKALNIPPNQKQRQNMGTRTEWTTEA